MCFAFQRTVLPTTQHAEAIQEPHWWHSEFHAIPGGDVVVQGEDWRAMSHLLPGHDCSLCGAEIGLVGHSSFDGASREPDESSRITCAYYIHICRPHLRHHVSNTQCRRFVDPLLRVAHRSSSSLVRFTSLIRTEKTRWDEPESHPAKVTRKEHPCVPTALLSLREMLRHKVLVDSLQSGLS